jgi:sulfoxide reductase heme-binding subunit YedZ
VTAALAATAGPSPLWYATRATGAVTLVLLTVTVTLGIMGTARFATPRWPRMITSGLHRNVSLLVVCFLTVHVLTALLDTFAPVGLAAAAVPFASPYRPLWLGLGTLASDLVAALVLTSLLRARLGLRAWRAVHWLAYAAWPVALWHGLGTGSDARLPVMLGIDAVCAVAILAALGWRLTLVAGPRRRLAAMAAVAAAPLATIVFAAAGPLQPGWAARAGTPPALLGHGGAAGAAASPPATGAGPAQALTAGPFAGTISQSGQEGPATVTITGRTSGAAQQDILITLHGTAAGDGGGLVNVTGELKVTPAGSAAAYSGPVTVNGDVLTATVTGPGSYRGRVTVVLSIQTPSVSGRLSVRPEGTS